jgi:hypothetical protein
MKTKLFLFAAVAAFAFSACDKNDDDKVNPNPQQNRTEMLVDREWMITSSVETVNGQTIDNFETVPVTSQDDIFRFNVNGEAIRDEGATKENGNPQIVEIAPWAFAQEERMLHVDFVSMPTNDEIVEISPTRLVLRNEGLNGVTITTFEAVQ